MAIYLEFSQPRFEHVRFYDGTRTSPLIEIVGRGPRSTSEGDGESGWLTVAGDEGTWEVTWRETVDGHLVVTSVVDHHPKWAPVEAVMEAKQEQMRAGLSTSTR